MSLPSSFTVYNASAGSGKTFTLVKEYLKILLSSKDIYKFQQILAVTFTNKAAFEMKERVLKSLQEFSEGEENDLFDLIQNELNLDKSLIQSRSTKILEAILQNYTAFSITTIDSFTHKIIKSFAFDLGLSQSFEVEMDAEELLKEAIDVLISKIGSDKEITRTLIQYAKDKSDNDQSWDITKDLLEFSKLLLNEDDFRNLIKISNKSLSHFEALNEKLKLQNKEIEKDFEKIGKEGIEIMNQLDLVDSDFSYSDLPNHFKKLIRYSQLNYGDLKFEGRLAKNIEEEKPLSSKSTPKSSKTSIENNRKLFIDLYEKSKLLFEQSNATYRLNRMILKSIIPLATLQYIQQELNQIKEENNIQLNSEFNHLISKHIQHQPAPFIYERIGNKYKHYFIDEMQDTSQMQWQNLIPLLHNTLSQEDSSLLLVGDGKQSIYRWRGGKAEQFIDLGNKHSAKHPFSIAKELKTLKTNFRSYDQIIDFNNQFFDFASHYLTSESYKELFKTTSKQETVQVKRGGFVSINFVDSDKEDEENDVRYARKVFDILEQVKLNFRLDEICIITRKRKEGVIIANYLTKKEIPIISSETLLLKNSLDVLFLLNLLEYSIQKSQEVAFRLLDYLHEYLQSKLSKHDFFVIYIKDDSFLNSLSIQFDENHFEELPLYEKMEYAIKSFGLMKQSNAYIQFFLDEIIRLQQREYGIQEVLDYWELNKEKLSIVSPEASDAVQIMTIHKSKGLEFPVVIYAGDVNCYEQINPKVWLNQEIEGFDDFLIPFTNELSELNEKTSLRYNLIRSELELDSLNLLYVTLTRAKEQLYVVTDSAKSTGKEAAYFSQYFKEFLTFKGIYQDTKLSYEFGEYKRASENNVKHATKHYLQENFNSILRNEHQIEFLPSSSKLWGTEQQEARVYGNLIHNILSKINFYNDIDEVLTKEHQSGAISSSMLDYLKEQLNEIISHPLLKEYYQTDVKIYNERPLIDNDGQILIPDRLIFLKNKLVILDYKTGIRSDSHKQQLLKYERLLKKMGCQNIKKVLVYLSDSIQVEEF